MKQRSTGWTTDGDDFMEKSGRQIAEEFFQIHGITCKITALYTEGTCGGHWCFRADFELDEENAAKWDREYGYGEVDGPG